MRSTPKPFGMAVIGLGNAAKAHARALADLRSSNVYVSGVFARDESRRKAFSMRHGVPEASSASELIASEKTHALLLLTPPDSRLAFLDLALAHRKPVLMEKPIGRNSAEALQMITMAEKAGIPLGVVLQHRKRKGALRLKQMIDRGELGRMGLVRLILPWWRDQAYYNEPGRGTLARDGGGVLISQAIHALDLMLHLVGPATNVTAMAGTTSLHRMETEDTAVVGVEFANGALGAIVATTAAYPGVSEVLSIDAEFASIELGNGELVVRWRNGQIDRAPDSIASGTGADPMAFDHSMHRDVIQEFVDGVTSADPHAPVSARSALLVHHLIDAILLSSREARRVPVGAISGGHDA